MRAFKLASGYLIPALGFGTWNIPAENAAALVEMSIQAGYRHIDCAAGYGNEVQVGEALTICMKEGIVKREDLFVTSKLWLTNLTPERVRPALEKSLQDLNLAYLDLLLVHWPVVLKEGHDFPPKKEDMIPLQDCPTHATWAEMQKAVDDGLVRSIGTSNYSAKKLNDLLKHPNTRIPPSVNQMECHPYSQLKDLKKYCDAKNIHLTGYSPLGSPARPDDVSKRTDEPLLLEDPTIQEISKKHGISPAQFLIHWGAVDGGHSVLCKSSSLERMKLNIASLDAFTLDEDDKRKINELDRQHRYLTGEFWVQPDGPYTLENIWDDNVPVESLLSSE